MWDGRSLTDLSRPVARVRGPAEWRFLGVLRRAAPALSLVWWGLIVARGALPAGFAIAMGTVLAAVQGGRPLAGPLAATGALFIATSALGPVHEAVSANLGARVSGWLHERLLDASRHRAPGAARPR